MPPCAGTAALCPEFRHIHDGLELADSYCFNPHKWMFTNFDCDCFYVADRAALIKTLSVLPEYLRNQATESGAVIDYRDWQIPLGRRFRALKLWFVIRHYGVEGLQHHVRRHVALAQQFAGWVRDDRPIRAGRARAAEPGLLPHYAAETKPTSAFMDRLNRERRSLSDAHQAGWEIYSAPVRRPNPYRSAPRGKRMEENSGRSENHPWRL